jgi:ligand-binding sensor protein
MAEHASGQPLAFRPVAGTLKFPVPVGISMQHLDGLMLSCGTTAATPRQQKERPRSDIGQRGSEAQPAGTPNTLDL